MRPRANAHPRAVVLVPLLVLAAGPARAGLEDCVGDLTPSSPSNRIVELVTTRGSVCIELLEDGAPLTAANFLDYLEAGDIDGTIIHRAIGGFVVQGGGFRVNPTAALEEIPDLPPVQNEPCTLDEDVPGQPGTLRCSQRGNVRGTLSMAKVGDPICSSSPQLCVPRPGPEEFPRPEYVNSATNQWFISLADNRVNLDNQNGGFTVFAQVLGDGMARIDPIELLPFVPLATSTLDATPQTLLPTFVNAPVESNPEEQTFGCFDVTELAALYDPGGLLEMDPTQSSQLKVVSGACGTTLASRDDFVPNPSGNPSCPTVDRLAIGAQECGGTLQGQLCFRPPGDPVYYQLTCDEVVESDARLAERRAGRMAVYTSQLVAIGQAIDLPEPIASLQAAGALGLLAALAARRRAAA